jgi:hypothetical protein
VSVITTRMQTVYALAAMLLLSACAHHGATFSPAVIADDTRALVYVYRPEQFSNAVLSPTVLVDGEAVFNTENGAYAYLYLVPGVHRFVLEDEQHITGNDVVELKLESGQHAYLRIDTALKFETGRPYTRRFDIVHVDEHTALNEISNCRQQQARMPSKYLWSADTLPASEGDADTGDEATFSIDKTSNPFAGKRSN